MTSETLKAFFNTHFFDESGNTRPVLASLTLRIDQEEIEIPGIQLQATHTIEDILKAYHHYLLENGIEDVLPPVTRAQKKPDTFVNVEQFTWRKNTYLVEEHKDDTFIVINSHSGKQLDEKSPAWKTLVKKYRNR